MKKHIHLYIIFAILVIIFVVVITGCSDSSKPYKYFTLSITPEQDSIVVNETANYSVKVQDAINLYGIHLEVSFDSTNVELPDEYLSVGDFWSDHYFLKETYNYPNKFSVVISLIGEKDGISGSGSLFEFNIKAIEQGICALEIINNSYLYLVDKNGELIEEFDNITIQNANLIIE